MTEDESARRARWAEQAARRGAIVPHFFEVFPDHVVIICGSCHRYFSRNLVPHLNEPVFVCPDSACAKRNWVPVRFQLKR